MIKESLKKVLAGQSLNTKEIKVVFSSFLNNSFSPTSAAALLTALALRGEKAEEIKAVRDILLAKAVKLHFGKKIKEKLVDVCGTGGKTYKTFNISTLVGFVLASEGIYVAKHGNRSFSSFCGSADIMEAWGININVSSSLMQAAIRKIGIGFLYAPLYHPAMKYIGGLRRELGIRTIFNLVGPVANPAFPSFQLLGVYREDFTEKIAKVLQLSGLRGGYVVWGEGIGDEVSIFGKTKVTTFTKKHIKNFYLKPSDFGLRRSRLEYIKIHNVKDSLKLAEKVLSAKPSAALDIVLANSALAFLLLRDVPNLKEGVNKAYTLLRSGKVKKKIEELREFLGQHA